MQEAIRRIFADISTYLIQKIWYHLTHKSILSVKTVIQSTGFTACPVTQSILSLVLIAKFCIFKLSRSFIIQRSSASSGETFYVLCTLKADACSSILRETCHWSLRAAYESMRSCPCRNTYECLILKDAQLFSFSPSLARLPDSVSQVTREAVLACFR